MAAFTPVGVEAVVKNLGGFTRGLNQMQHEIAQTGQAAEGIGGRFNSLGKSVLGVGAVMAKVAAGAVIGMGAAVTGLGVASVNTAVSFESAFAGVLKTVDGLENEMGQLNQTGLELRQGFRDMAKEVPLTVEELAKIGEIGGQLGVPKEALLDFTETVAALGVTTNLSTDEAATALARIANIFDVSAADMGQNIKDMGNVIVELGNNFATTESEIATFALRIAGAGNIAGLTQGDILAIGAAMSSVGVQAEAGGTAVQKMLLQMNNAAAASSAGMVDHAESIQENTDRMLDLNAQLVKLEAQTGVTGQALWDEYQAFQAAGGSAEEFGRKLGDTRRAQLFKTIRSIQELTAETQTLQAEHGKPVQDELLATFARVSGRTVDQFKKDWKDDAAGVFTDFVEGLNKEGDNAVKVLEELELGDQRLVRGFLSLANAGDLLEESMVMANAEFADGSALAEEAAKRYRTTEAQMQLLKNTIRDVAITIGDALLPFINDLIARARPLIEDFGRRLPEIIEGIIARVKALIAVFQERGVLGLAEALGFSEGTIALMQNVAGRVMQVLDFVREHWEEFRAALIAVGALLGVAATIAAIGGAIALLTNPITLIIAAVGALGYAWQSNFLGIRDTLTAFWENTARPALEQLYAWLKENLPIAIAALAQFWQNTLLPALQVVWGFIQNSIIPLLATLIAWLAENVPVALQTLADFWQTILLPAIQSVWSFLQEYVIPLIQALIEVWIAILKLELTILAGIWQNVLLPALRAVWNFIQGTLIPIFQRLTNFIADEVGPRVKWLTDLVNSLKSAFQKVADFIKKAIDKLKEFADEINKLGDKLPDWMTPGSPTPLELGLRGINDAMRQLSSVELPRLSASMTVMPARFEAGAGMTTTNNTNFNMTVNTAAAPQSVIQQFEVMRALVG